MREFKVDVRLAEFKKRRGDDKIIIRAQNIKFLYQKYMNRPKIVEHEGPLTLSDILHYIKVDYRKIYREELGTTTIPETGKIHRRPTNGKYGIYGPYYDDIILDKFRYDSLKQTILI